MHGATMREGSRTQWCQKQGKQRIYLLVAAGCSSNQHSVLVKLIHVGGDGTPPLRIHSELGVIERHCTWVLHLLGTPKPLYVPTNTIHPISVAIENQILSQHRHIERPLWNQYCRVVFLKEVGVDNPQWVYITF